MVGKNLGNLPGVSNLQNHPPPQSQKMTKNDQFCRIIPPNAQHRLAPLVVPLGKTLNGIPHLVAVDKKLATGADLEIFGGVKQW